MASELRVNTLKDAAGSNEVAMTYVANGSAKAWANTSASAITDSLNTSSFTDNSTGNHTIGISSAMGNATYSVTGFARADGSDTGYAYTLTANVADTKTTSAFQFSSRYQGGGGGSIYDATENGINVHGDLA